MINFIKNLKYKTDLFISILFAVLAVVYRDNTAFLAAIVIMMSRDIKMECKR